MKVIGITGRSGCGKSTVTRWLAEQGIPCIDADLIAREVLYPGSPCLDQLQQRFGSDILDEEGILRRRLLADRAFATPEGTAALTAITQPEILRRIGQRLDEASSRGHSLAAVDGAVIVGTPFQARCDAIVLVSAPYEESVRRICARDGIAPEMARRRLDAQTPEETLRAAATYELRNDGTPEQLLSAAAALFQKLQKEDYGAQG